jgi:hypothetical protein
MAGTDVILSVSDLVQDEKLLEQLRGYLEGFVGDTLAELPNQERETPVFTELAKKGEGFATAVLRRRFDDPGSLRLIRRFLAALLPSEEASSDTGRGFLDHTLCLSPSMRP